MSNEREVRIFSIEISKVSAATLFVCGLVDPKVSPEQLGVADGQTVNIPLLWYSRYQLGQDDMWKVWSPQGDLSIKLEEVGKSAFSF